MVKPASNDNTSTDSCNDSIDFHFPSFDNYLHSSYSEEEDSFASKLIKKLFPTKSGWIGATSMPRSDLENFISFVCNFHPPSNSSTRYQAHTYLSWTSNFKLLTTISPHRFSTRKPTHTATFTMILLTTPNSSHQSHFLNYFVYSVSAVTMRILRPRLTKCLLSFPAATTHQTPYNLP